MKDELLEKQNRPTDRESEKMVGKDAEMLVRKIAGEIGRVYKISDGRMLGMGQIE